MVRFFAAVLLVALTSVGTAQAFDNPKALVEAIYSPYQNGSKPTDLDQYYSQGLLSLFEQAAAQHAAEQGGGKDSGLIRNFNPFISGENALLFDLTISEPQTIGEHSVVAVSYNNFDHPTLLSVSLINETGSWKVDDVASMGKDSHWLLSWLLQYDPVGS